MALFDGGIAAAVANVASTVIDRVLPDPAQAAAAKLDLEKFRQAGAFNEMEQQIRLSLAQTDVNKIEAASPDFFRSGWRPAVGWVCALGLGYQNVARPLLIGFLGTDFPALDMGTLMQCLMGLLGLGAMRTVEKIKGVA